MKLTYASVCTVLALCASVSASADTFTYTYKGPNFFGSTDHLEVSFTTSAPLTANSVYSVPAAAGVLSGNVKVVKADGSSVAGLTLPLSELNLATDATASDAVAGIQAWMVLGDISNISGAGVSQTGVHYQAYTMNTLKKIVGTVTGPYAYEQGTITTFYSSCAGISGCSLAGNGQPYTTDYSGIINPSGTSSANWSVIRNVTSPATNPPPAPIPPLTFSGTLPPATAGAAYTTTFTATGGVAPYAWASLGLPAGLNLDPVSGIVSGTTQQVGSFAVTIAVQDSSAAATVSQQKFTLNVVAPAVTSNTSCNAPSGTKKVEGKSAISQVQSGSITVGRTLVLVPSCAQISWNGASGFAVGQKAEYQGYGTSAGIVATKITIN